MHFKKDNKRPWERLTFFFFWGQEKRSHLSSFKFNHLHLIEKINIALPWIIHWKHFFFFQPNHNQGYDKKTELVNSASEITRDRQRNGWELSCTISAIKFKITKTMQKLLHLVLMQSNYISSQPNRIFD